MQINKSIRRLPLSGAMNTRDLGGYPCRGGAVRWGMFLRSDNLTDLAPKDIDYLVAYGLTDVVDLRRPDEALRAPSALLDTREVTTHSLPLCGSMHGLDMEGDVPGSMSGLYLHILDQSRAEVAEVMRVLAAAKGCALFHCAVGKDRTGVIAMLLLKLAGAQDADVIADYSITDIYMTEVYEAQANVFRYGDIPDYILRSQPASMERTLRHLRECYGSAEEYLTKCGLAKEEIAALRQKLVQPAVDA